MDDDGASGRPHVFVSTPNAVTVFHQRGLNGSPLDDTAAMFHAQILSSDSGEDAAIGLHLGDGSRPVAVYEIQSSPPQLALRKLSGPVTEANINDEAQWGAQEVISTDIGAADGPALAAGPNGLFLSGSGHCPTGRGCSCVSDPDASNLVFALSAVLDTALLCAGAAWAARGNPVWRRLAPALLACVGTLAIKGWFLLRLGVELGFGVMHVLWLDLVVALPAAALLLLFLAGRRAGLPLRLVALAACLLAPVGAYASLIEPERLQLERAELTVQKRLESAAGLATCACWWRTAPTPC